jgi:hypothetical protein
MVLLVSIMATLSYAPLDGGCSFARMLFRRCVLYSSGGVRILSVVVGVDGGDDRAFNTNKNRTHFTPRQMTLMSTTTGASTDGVEGRPCCC